MKRHLLLFVTFLLITLSSLAQNAVRWNFNVVASETEKNVYTITFKANIEENWHLYSQHLPSPEDGPLPTVFGFDESENIELIGDVEEEKDKVHSVKDEAFGVTVNYFDGIVTFTQKVRLKSPTKTELIGFISYMTCSETMCVPNDVDFTIPIGG